jgi:hypothetical protein
MNGRRALLPAVVAIGVCGWLCVGEAPRVGTLGAQEKKNEAATPGNWELRTHRVGKDQFVYVRFNRVSGESWRCIKGEWHKFTEPEPLEKGDYDIRIDGEAADDTVSIVRIEKVTGKCWFLSDVTDWTVIPEAKQ